MAVWPSRRATAAGLRDYWCRCLSQLAGAFGDLCAYACMYVQRGTVDHFHSVAENRGLSYEWSNYRFAAQWLNSSKGNKTGILDPFEVVDGWFEVHLPSLQLMLTDAVPAGKRALAESTLQQLPLVRDARIIDIRRHWMREYTSGGVGLDGLRRHAPLLARAVEKWQRERPGKPLPRY